MSYIVLSDNMSITIKQKDGYDILLRTIYVEDDEFAITKYALSNIKKILKKIFETTLTDNEVAILNCKFELEGNFYDSINELSEIRGLSHEKIIHILNRALRKLRNPNKVDRGWLTGRTIYLLDDYCVAYDNFVEKQIKEDIKNVFEHKPTNFLTNILAKNHIDIKCSYTNKIDTICCDVDGEKTIYKYLCDDKELIYESIFNDILCKRKNITINIFSLQLSIILMLKGYWYIHTIIEDNETLINELQNGGFIEYAEELNEYIEYYKRLKVNAEAENEEKLIMFEVDIFIEDCSSITIEELISRDEYKSNEKYTKICNKIKSIIDNPSEFKEIAKSLY